MGTPFTQQWRHSLRHALPFHWQFIGGEHRGAHSRPVSVKAHSLHASQLSNPQVRRRRRRRSGRELSCGPRSERSSPDSTSPGRGPPPLHRKGGGRAPPKNLHALAPAAGPPEINSRHSDLPSLITDVISRRGDDTVGNPHLAQICKFEFFELILLLNVDKQFSVEQCEPTVSL